MSLASFSRFIKHTLGKAYGYEMSFELIILNAVITCAGLALMSTKHTEAIEAELSIQFMTLS